MVGNKAKYNINNGSRMRIRSGSIFKIEPDTPPVYDGLGYMQIGTTFRIS